MVQGTCAAAGFVCVAERHLRKQDNLSFSETSADEIRTMVRAVARHSFAGVAPSRVQGSGCLFSDLG